MAKNPSPVVRARGSTFIDSMVEEELRWHYLYAAGEMGEQSNFMSMVNKLQGGYSGGNAVVATEYSDRVMEASARDRKIMDRLRAAGPRHRAVLELCYGKARPSALHSYDTLAGLVEYTRSAQLEYSASATDLALVDWLNRLAEKANNKNSAHHAVAQEILRRIIAEAGKMLGDAMKAYHFATVKVRDRS